MHVENATLAEVLSFCPRIAYRDVPEENSCNYAII